MIRLEKSHENPVTHFPKLEVGQKVVIKSLDWYYIKKDYYGIVKLSTESFTSDMSEYCGKTAIITEVRMNGEKPLYLINLDNGVWNWSDEMFESVNPITYLPKLELGQKVTIKSLDWYNSNKDKNGAVILSAETFVEEMAEYCGKTATILDVFKDLDGGDTIMYCIDLDHRGWHWTDEMFEPEMVEDVKDPEE